MKKIFVFLISFILLTACTFQIPRNFPSSRDAYPNDEIDKSLINMGAYRQNEFNFPYENVYNSVEKGLSFSQINITKSSYESGKFYGIRSIVRGSTEKFYYLVKVKELAPSKCSVEIYSKEIQGATYFKWGGWVVVPSAVLAAGFLSMVGDYPGMAIGGSLMYPAIISPIVAINNSTSKERARLKWSPNDEEYLDRVMSFIRTDLLQNQ